MINLLPFSEKRELAKVRKEKIQSIVLLLLNFFLVCLVLLSLFLNIYFKSYLERKEVLIVNLEVFEEPEEMEEKTTKLNNSLKEINSFYQDKIYYSFILNQIAEKLPSEAYLDRISFLGNKISLSGFISSRNDLLILKERLEKGFKEVDFPPINWVKRENIDFFTTFLYEKD